MNYYDYRWGDPWDWDLTKAGRRAPRGGGYYTNRATGESRFFRGGQFVPATYEEAEGSPMLPVLEGSEAPQPKRRRKRTETEGSDAPQPKRRRKRTETEGSDAPAPKRRRRGKTVPANHEEGSPMLPGFESAEGSDTPAPKRRRRKRAETEGSDAPQPKPKRRRKKQLPEDPPGRGEPLLLPSSYGGDIPLLPPPRVPPPLPEDPSPSIPAAAGIPWPVEEGENELAHWDREQNQWQIQVSNEALERAQSLFPHFDLHRAVQHGLPIPRRILGVLGRLAQQERGIAQRLRQQGYRPEEIALRGLAGLGGLARQGVGRLAEQERKTAQRLRQQGYKPEEIALRGLAGLGGLAQQGVGRLTRRLRSQ